MFSFFKKRATPPQSNHPHQPYNPTTSPHNTPHARVQRANNLFLAQKYTSSSECTVKVMKQYVRSASGTSVKTNTAFVVDGQGLVLMRDWRFHTSEDKAVRRLSVMLVEEWRERQVLVIF
ncbi:hypothetical protein DPSP01_011513 [Paraphaeosphaeria sporulosa]